MSEILKQAKRMGWDTSKLMCIPKDRIDEIFKRNDECAIPHQATVLVELYRMVIPEWDKIKKIENGWPIVSKKTNEYIFRKFMDFDDKHHPNVIRSGLWLNNGFSTNAELVPLELSPIPHFHAYIGHLEYEYLVEEIGYGMSSL